jgi:hypothetical protein
MTAELFCFSFFRLELLLADISLQIPADIAANPCRLGEIRC